MPDRFLQLHTLTSYPASLLNRDDAGFAKRMTFGGAVRTRISSQCLKRHWRVYDGEHGLHEIEAPASVRSRESFERFVVAPLVADGFDLAVVRTATAALVDKVLGARDKAEKPERSGGRSGAGDAEAAAVPPVRTAQVTVLGRPELDYLRSLVAEAVRAEPADGKAAAAVVEKRIKGDKALRENLKALHPGSLEAGLSAALFGRMVTGDVLARTDAAVHVAHALTVHAQYTESDYFSAIDDLSRDDGEQGSGHINASELTSGVYYGYIVVDLGGLLENLGGDPGLVADVVSRLVRIVATVSPGAKRGATAPYAYSHLLMAELGTAQPRSLANAFLDPVRAAGNIAELAAQRLATHLAALDSMYASGERRAYAALLQLEGLGERRSVPALAEWVGHAMTVG
jgi:CRISPR system Cascade subunit CasC